MADAWAILAPINWYNCTSNLKLMFDRLVCMNGGNPDEETIGHKDPQKAMALEHTDQWKEMSVNHLEGRTAAFFCYGDDGGDELGSDGRPKILKHKNYFNPEEEPFENDRLAYQPLVWQCRYGGVEVPDHLWTYHLIGKNKKYSDTQAEDMVKEDTFMQGFNTWVKDFECFVMKKGKVKPGKHRAYRYKPPSHILANVKDGINYFKMMVGKAPESSSPNIQEELGLNKDATWHPKKGEGEKLRDE